MGVLAACGDGQTNAPETRLTSSALSTAFPLKRASGQRCLVDQNGAPFLMLGDSPWELLTTLGPADATPYLANAQSRGVTSILVNGIDNHYTATSTGGNANGDLPFSTALDGTRYTNSHTQSPDFSTPNAPYWNQVDATMSLARSDGFLVLFYPIWIGNPVGDPSLEGYYNALNAQSSVVRRGYGAFLSNRYKSYPNLIWVVGGDGNPANSAIVTDVVAGIQSVSGLQSTVFSFDGLDGTSPLTTTEGWPASFVDNGINNIYTDILTSSTHPYTYSQAKFEWQRTDFPQVPYFQKEGAYQNGQTGWTHQLVRAQTWQALLGGACGYHWGSAPLWSFGSGWQTDLSSRSALDMRVVNAFFAARQGALLVPDWANVFLTNGGSRSNAAFASAAIASSRTWGAIYVPTDESLTVNLSVLSGPVNAHWVDPTTGASTLVAGSPFKNSGSFAFAPPGNNASGDGDWVLAFDRPGTGVPAVPVSGLVGLALGILVASLPRWGAPPRRARWRP
jgi:hypothetical protein